MAWSKVALEKCTCCPSLGFSLHVACHVRSFKRTDGIHDRYMSDSSGVDLKVLLGNDLGFL